MVHGLFFASWPLGHAKKGLGNISWLHSNILTDTHTGDWKQAPGSDLLCGSDSLPKLLFRHIYDNILR